MRHSTLSLVAACVCAAVSLVGSQLNATSAPAVRVAQNVDLAGALRANQLRGVNRTVTASTARQGAVHVSAAEGPGVIWVAGTEAFSNGSIEVMLRGKDVYQQSFPGIAFHRQDDKTYEAVYVRPFNFRVTDPERHVHAVQYVSVPNFDWPKLRQDFPNKYESAVTPDVSPTAWVSLKVVVARGRVQAYVGGVASPTLNVDALGGLTRGGIGLWVGNNSDGEFADLRVSAAN